MEFIALPSGKNTEMGMLAKGDLLQYVCNGFDVLGISDRLREHVMVQVRSIRESLLAHGRRCTLET